MAAPKTDEQFMQAAIAQARMGLGQTSPNPAVGAVLVVQGKIVATGFHKRAGAPHAEVECLRQYRSKVPSSATLYVTLEPCSTAGRTGACTAEIQRAGIRRVVIGTADPNPRHAGRGIALLRNAGVDVRLGVLAEECTALNEAFNKWITTGMPFVIAKCGMTLDGRLTKAAADGRWITSVASRRHARQLRASVDAIVVGAGTVRDDDPRLTARGVRGAKQPWRVILSHSRKLPATARIFTDKHAERTLVFSGKSIAIVLRELGRKEITSVLIEGGGDVLGQALDNKLIDRVQIYIGPLFSGGNVLAFAGKGVALPAEATRLERVVYERITNDVCVTGRPSYAGAAIA